LQSGNVARLLVLLHLILDMLHSADVSHAIENSLRLGRQHRAAQRNAPVMSFGLNRARVRADAAELRAYPRDELFIVGRLGRPTEVGSDFGLQTLQAIAQVARCHVRCMPCLVTNTHASVAEHGPAARTLTRVKEVHQARPGGGASTPGHKFVHCHALLVGSISSVRYFTLSLRAKQMPMCD
jgi:hypothetical protein